MPYARNGNLASFMPRKNTAQLTLFPETRYEYHVFISPPKDVIEDVKVLKEKLKEMIGLAPYNETPAHITLAAFEAYESADVKENVRNAVGDIRAFEIKVDGYDVFQNSNTLHLKIANPEKIADLVDAIISQRKRKKQLVRQISILDTPKRPVKKKLNTMPHITIARGIPQDDFERIGGLLGFEYTAEWICDKITIRRRLVGSDGRFSAYAQISLDK